MYNDFFGFRENPFPVTPNPHIFFSNSVYQRTYANLLYGICERTGVITLTGEAGTGKTTLLRRLMNNLEHTVHFAFCPYTTLSFDELLDFICTDFGLPQQSTDCVQRIATLQQFLTAQQLRGQHAALLIDEAHNLRPEVLAGLAELAKLTAGNERLLPIALAGQDELRRNLEHPDVAPLRRQIAISCQLDRLKNSEVGPFIYHRLRAVGYDQQDLFPSAAVQRISTYAHGIPRSINIICDNALLIAAIQVTKVVTPEIIDEVARDLQLNAIRLIHIDDSALQPAGPRPQKVPVTEQRRPAIVKTPQSSARNIRRKTSRTFSQRKSRIVLWSEIGIAAVLFFLLFFRSSPVPNAARPPLNDPLPHSAVEQATPASQRPTQLRSGEKFQPLTPPQKQMKKKPTPDSSQPEISEVTVATLLKSPSPIDAAWQKRSGKIRRDPFAIPLPLETGKEPSLQSPSLSSRAALPTTATNDTHSNRRMPLSTSILTASIDRGQEELTSPNLPKALLLNDEKNLTPLMAAVMRGQATTVQTLLRNGTRVNSQTKTGRTALMLAALTGQDDILQDLIKRGATVNMKNTEGWTALMYAARNGHAQIVHTLLKSGARIDAKSKDGGTALSHALRNGHQEVARLLRTSQVRPSKTDRSDKSAISLKQSKALLLLSTTGKRNQRPRTKNQGRTSMRSSLFD